MNIVLTQKDADSILGYLREELKNLQEFETDVTKHFAELESQYNESNFLQQQDECKEMFEGTKGLFDKRMKEISDERSKLYRFIELLTCGSEELNGTA